jgi:PAS domain S-box-containing protein
LIDIDSRAQADAIIQDLLVGEAVAHSGLAVLVADDEMQFLAASESACDLLGYSRTELLALRVPDIVVEGDASDRYQALIKARTQEGAITLRRKDGSTVMARYDARRTRVSQLEYYVSILRPLS